jgi:IS605 OrfB family transposase
MKKRKKKKFNIEEDEKYILLKDKIAQNTDKIWLPSLDIEYTNLSIHTSSNNKIYIDNNAKTTVKLNVDSNNKKHVYQAHLVDMYPTERQKQILDKWFKAFIEMYNYAQLYIKTEYREHLYIKNKMSIIHEEITNIKTLLKNKKKPVISEEYEVRLKELLDEVTQLSRSLILGKDWTDARSCLKDIAKDIQKESIKEGEVIYKHILDNAVHLAYANFKSGLTNLKNGNIQRFRLRYWRFNRRLKSLNINNEHFTEEGLSPHIFGKIKCEYDGKDFDLGLVKTKYKTECKIIYDNVEKKYILIISEKVKPENTESKKKFISLDPGVNTFMTGISENEVVKLGNDFDKKVKKYLTKIDYIESLTDTVNDYICPISKKKAEKAKEKKRRKIKNIVKDLHWHIIKYLTNEYKTIIIGDMSVKSIVNKETSKLTKMTKRVATSMSFYKFRERLKYKCELKKRDYTCMNEKYTSKMCTNCTGYQHDLGRKKKYKCSHCKIEIDRDVNGARNICLKLT